MAVNRPTLAELIERATTDLSTRLIGSSKALRRSVIAAIGSVIGGTAHLVYGYVAWASEQLFPDTAEAEFLARWASIYDISRNAATYAEGEAEFEATEGSSIPEGTIIQRADGVEYTVDEDADEDGGVITVSLTCTTAGETGNADADDALEIQTPIAGVTSEGVVGEDGLSGGSDEEDDDSLRARLLLKIQEPPHGGSDADYEQWALENTGVTRAWVFPSQYGDGTVGVAIVRDDDDTIVASSGEIAEVQAYIDERRPVTADVTVWSPTAYPVNFTIEVDPDTTDVREAVEAELTDLILRESEPGGTLLLSKIRESVSSAADEDDNTVLVPSGDVEVPEGSIATMGTVTWI